MILNTLSGMSHHTYFRSAKRIPTIKRKQISENNFSFGIKEYIEIPGAEYQRDIGIIGLDVKVVFKRSGRRVGLRKIQRGISSRVPRYNSRNNIIYRVKYVQCR